MSETDCTEILREIELYVDREVAAGRSAEIERHLDACNPCLEHAEFRTRLRALVSRKCCAEDVPQDLADKIRSLLAEN